MRLDIDTGNWRKIRRHLPDSLRAIEPGRRISVLRPLIGIEGEAGRVAALKILLELPATAWNNLAPAHIADLLEKMPWLSLLPSPVAPFEDFTHDGVRYFFPADNFENGTCLEYPFADEQMQAFVEKADDRALRMLTATLCREAEPDSSAALRRADRRVRLHSRAEVEARADRLEKCPLEWQVLALFYFVGVKTLVHRLYGPWLFNQPETDENGEAVEDPPKTDGLGWWGLFMDAAGGDLQKLEAIEQGNFHTFCLMEVRRRKQAKEAEMAMRLSNPRFGEHF